MDSVANTAQQVARDSASILQVAAEELAKQASTVAAIANSSDPIAWLAGEEDVDGGDLFGVPEVPPPALVPVPLAALQSWGTGWACDPSLGWGQPQPAAPDLGAESEPPAKLPFAVDHDLNHQVFLWEGDPLAMEVDALIAPAAVGYVAGTSTVFQRVLKYGGRDLRADLRLLESCRSGEARSTKAYGLPCLWLLLTVGPKYKDKYQIAAQNTLNSCYRECLLRANEAEATTVAVPCTWYDKGYPLLEQAHVALRTVRKCMEKLKSIKTVVFVALTSEELNVYESVLPLYFPRTAQEAVAAAKALPESCWSEWGEVALEERKIRLTASPLIRGDSDEDDDRGDDPLFSQGDDDDRSFLDARTDTDDVAKRRLDCTMCEAETPEQAVQACIRYLRRARDFRPEPEMSRYVYRAPKPDRYGRRVVVLLGARLPTLGVRDERTLPLFVKELELLQGEKFVLVYANSDVSAMDTTKLETLQEMLAVISVRYRSILDQFLVLHPGLWFRAAFALGRAVSDSAASLWHDTVYLETLAELSAYATMEQLSLPQYIRYYDQS